MFEYCRKLLTLAAVASLAVTPLAAGEPLAVFEAHEITGRDWPRTLVTYEVGSQRAEGSGRQRASSLIADHRSPITLSSPATVGNVRLVDAATGAEVPFQLWDVRLGRKPLLRPAPIESARISFYAELPAGGSYRYELHSGKPDIPIADRRSPITAAPDGDRLTLDNGIVAIRLPAVGRQTFDPPLRLAGDHAAAAAAGLDRLAAAGLAFGPIAGIRLADGTWVGGSYFSFEPIEAVQIRQPDPLNPGRNYLDELPDDAWERAVAAVPAVTSYETVINETGPLFVEAQVRFTFDNGGHYRLTVRMFADRPDIDLDESMDLITTCQPDDPLYVNILLGNSDWRPDAVFGHGVRIPDQLEALHTALEQHGFEPSGTSLPLVYEANETVVADVMAHYPWNPALHYFALVNTDELTAVPASPPPPADADSATPEQQDNRTVDARFVAVVPQHAGSWRGAHFVFPPKNPHMFQQLMTHSDGTAAMRWSIRNQPHPQNLLHTGEYDPDFGLTGMRRIWRLIGGPFQYHDTLHPLRAYQGYVNLDRYKEWVLAWDDQTRAGLAMPVENSRVMQYVNARLRGRPGSLSWVTHFLQATEMGMINDIAAEIDNPDTSEEHRGQLRVQLAALCHLVSEPDFNTRASTTHQGNPNMPINRFFALPFAARLITDHPRAEEWLNVSADYVAFKGGMNTAPGGAWSELVTYYYASAPMLVNGALVAEQAGLLDASTRELVTQIIEFTFRLMSPPDPRVGVRTVPGFGHEGITISNTGRVDGGAHMLSGAALLRETEPQRAAVLAWGWDQLGRPSGNPFDSGFGAAVAHHADLVADASTESVKAALASAWMPGFGAVLRAHPMDAEETFLGYRQGYLASHSDANQCDFVLYARGAPLTVTSVHAYAIHGGEYQKLNNEFGWHNRLRFGEQSDFGGWPGGGPVSAVHRHFFSDSLDYLRGIGDYPSTSSGQAASQRWTRQILFLKGKRADGPNYFVFRDSTHSLAGNPDDLQRKWWYQRTLGGADLVEPSETGFDYAGEFGVRMQAHFLQPARVQVESRQAGRAGGIPGTDIGDETMTVTAVGPVDPDQDIMVTLYPYAEGEPTPRYEPLADGVARITTPDSVDYVFLHRKPMSYVDDDIAFEGMAGAVRVFPDEVHLVIAEGEGTVSYKGFTLAARRPATQVVPLTEIARGGTLEVPAEKVTIDFALDPRDGAIGDRSSVIGHQSLVRKSGGITRYLFNSPTNVNLELPVASLIADHRSPMTLRFTGRRGGIEVDENAGTVRLVMLDGETLGYGDARVEFGDGPYDITFHHDHVKGKSEGPARFLILRMPPGIDRLPAMLIDGIRYAPGTHDDLAIIPVSEGQNDWRLENLPQPPVFRNWKKW